MVSADLAPASCSERLQLKAARLVCKLAGRPARSPRPTAGGVRAHELPLIGARAQVSARVHLPVGQRSFPALGL